jgi:hypothetical protein
MAHPLPLTTQWQSMMATYVRTILLAQISSPLLVFIDKGVLIHQQLLRLRPPELHFNQPLPQARLILQASLASLLNWAALLHPPRLLLIQWLLKLLLLLPHRQLLMLLHRQLLLHQQSLQLLRLTLTPRVLTSCPFFKTSRLLLRRLLNNRLLRQRNIPQLPHNTFLRRHLLSILQWPFCFIFNNSNSKCNFRCRSIHANLLSRSQSTNRHLRRFLG